MDGIEMNLTDVDPIIIFIIALFVKHYFADFQWQTSYMYLNKGKWGHPGGLLHSGIHAGLTIFVMTFWNEYLGGTVLTTQFILLAALAEFVSRDRRGIFPLQCPSRGLGSWRR